MELTNTNDLVVILAVIIMFTILAYLVKNNFFNQKGVFRRRGLTIGGTDMGPTTDHSGLSFDPIYTKDMVFDSIGATVRLTDEIPDEKLISFSKEGLEFLGTPKTPPYHWKELSSKISIKEKKSLQQLHK